MEKRLRDRSDFLHSLFDVIPSPLFVVDSDVCILYVNAAASRLTGVSAGRLHSRRGGEALLCIYSQETAGGCGRASPCADCVVRNAVGEAIHGGTVHRRRTRMELHKDGGIEEVHLFVTAAPFNYDGEHLALLIIEDISELIQLRSLLPICASCKRIRNDGNYWEHVESYFKSRLDVDFSHSICPQCKKDLYPQFSKG